MILSFSGTGNSHAAAASLAAMLGDAHVKIDRAFYDNPVVTPAAGDRRVVWVAPVYSWGMPPVMRDIIGRMQVADHAAIHHVVMTCGDDAGYADRQWRKAIGRRGLRVGTVSTVIMPNNYVAMAGFDVDPAELASEKLAAVGDSLRAVASRIAGGAAGTAVTRGRFPWVKTAVVYPWFIAHRMSPRGFRATDACTGCGACVRACPLNNISLRDRRPDWADTCAFCLACYHHCPTHAIDWLHTTARKGQYLHP